MFAPPVTPTRPSRPSVLGPTTPPPLGRPNPRKRPLPSPSPIAIAFNLADIRTASAWSRRASRTGTDASQTLFEGLSDDASSLPPPPPPAPLLPPAPVFEVLPLPDTPTSPLGPHSIPMRRSPAISSLSHYTLEAQREAAELAKLDERKWFANSISRHELGTFQVPLVRVPDATCVETAPAEEDEQDAPHQAFHLELTSPDLAPLRNPRPTRALFPVFDDGAHTPDASTAAMSGLSWSSSLPSLSTSSSTSTLSSLGSRSPSPFSSPGRLQEMGLSPRCRSPAFELAKSLSIATLHSEHREVSSLALRRLEKRHREQRPVHLTTSPVLGLGLTLNP
ncbi:hypothetical protein JCM10908_000574 [Rhodotorula pacifica]|uniref:uncharacterized protein n=1 Tax=Rhodotorula pacifica TaxID=1495444 RepID=UPI00317F41B9